LKTLIEFTEHAYDRLLVVVEGITEKELHWRPIPEMNSAYKIFATLLGSASFYSRRSSRELQGGIGTMTTNSMSRVYKECSESSKWVGFECSVAYVH